MTMWNMIVWVSEVMTFGKVCAPTIQNVSVKFREFLEQYLRSLQFGRITFKLGKFTNFKAIFLSSVDGYSLNAFIKR